MACDLLRHPGLFVVSKEADLFPGKVVFEHWHIKLAEHFNVVKSRSVSLGLWLYYHHLLLDDFRDQVLFQAFGEVSTFAGPSSDVAWEFCGGSNGFCFFSRSHVFLVEIFESISVIKDPILICSITSKDSSLYPRIYGLRILAVPSLLQYSFVVHFNKIK